jgi:hypothetical protein
MLQAVRRTRTREDRAEPDAQTQKVKDREEDAHWPRHYG